VSSRNRVNKYYGSDRLFLFNISASNIRETNNLPIRRTKYSTDINGIWRYVQYSRVIEQRLSLCRSNICSLE
jgi:hypothetical protein